MREVLALLSHLQYLLICISHIVLLWSGLHEALLRLEFDHYRVDGRDTITGLDFARSIISSVDLATVDSYLDRAASLPANLAQVQVSSSQSSLLAGVIQIGRLCQQCVA